MSESVEVRVPGVSRSPRTKTDRASVFLADVVRFTGHNQIELIDLIHAGVLEQVPGRGVCELTASSLQAWMGTSV